MLADQRKPLAPAPKLAIKLRFLATGMSFHSLAFDFCVGQNTISLFEPQVCEAICEEYSAEVFQTPNTPDTWRPVAERSSQRWDFHHCCGTFDSKHIAIRKPLGSGNTFFNYKGFFSVVLLAVVDGD